MRRSTLLSEAEHAGLFSGVLGRGGVAASVSDRAWLRALLDVEAALARAAATTGLVPAAAAERIAEVCQDVDAFDPAELGRAAAASGNPVEPLVRRIEELTGPEAGAHVHRGATSQDVMDTGLMLLSRNAIATIRDDLRRAATFSAKLAEQHLDAPISGRTLLQQALPTTFGLKAAGWLTAIDVVEQRLGEVSDRLPVQMFGAVGTLAAFDGRGFELLEALGKGLGLRVPPVAWHTMRLPVADLAGALGAAAGVVAKVALDVTLLAQSEVREVFEDRPGSGGSSTMPHKRNAIAAVAARAGALRAPGLAATLFTAMAQEHERAAGAWHAEWETLTELLRAAGSAAAWLAECLEHLAVDTVRMADNLASADAPRQAEGLAQALAPSLGRAAAHDRVARAVRRAESDGRPLADALAEDGDVPDELVRSLRESPAPDTGDAPGLVRRALVAHAAVRGTS